LMAPHANNRQPSSPPRCKPANLRTSSTPPWRNAPAPVHFDRSHGYEATPIASPAVLATASPAARAIASPAVRAIASPAVTKPPYVAVGHRRRSLPTRHRSPRLYPQRAAWRDGTPPRNRLRLAAQSI